MCYTVPVMVIYTQIMDIRTNINISLHRLGKYYHYRRIKVSIYYSIRISGPTIIILVSAETLLRFAVILPLLTIAAACHWQLRAVTAQRPTATIKYLKQL